MVTQMRVLVGIRARKTLFGYPNEDGGQRSGTMTLFGDPNGDAERRLASWTKPNRVSDMETKRKKQTKQKKANSKKVEFACSL